MEGMEAALLEAMRGVRRRRPEPDARGAMEAVAAAALDVVAWWRWSSGCGGMGMGEAEWSGGGGDSVAGD